jgi:hypothetical protein
VTLTWLALTWLALAWLALARLALAWLAPAGLILLVVELNGPTAFLIVALAARVGHRFAPFGKGIELHSLMEQVAYQRAVRDHLQNLHPSRIRARAHAAARLTTGS